MKDVSILIANHNSFEAIQLCIESIRKLTTYNNYNIIVFDDNSRNKMDLDYLRQAHNRGWLELIEYHSLDRTIPLERVNHPAVYWHGRSLNILINACLTRYAVIVDCDIQILDGSWLDDFLLLVKRNDVLGVAKTTPKHMHPTDGYILPEYQTFFILLDMEKYRDGMTVNWIPMKQNREREPYRSLFAEWYPPENIEYFYETCNVEIFDKNAVYGDPGTSLWLKMQYDNPKGYQVITIPDKTYHKMRHFVHTSIIGDTYLKTPDERFQTEKFRFIQLELNNLRQHG